jgi:hypothetical protein
MVRLDGLEWLCAANEFVLGVEPKVQDPHIPDRMVSAKAANQPFLAQVAILMLNPAPC